MLRTIASAWPVDQGPNPDFCGEEERLVTLAAHGLDELQDDDELSALVRFAANLCDAPISTVSLIEADRQRFLAREGLEAGETPRSVSFCAHTMMGNDLMIISDASTDPRFADNALVTGEPHIRFYAGAPLFSREGAPLGALCVIDTKPRPEGLSELQREGLLVLAESVTRRLSYRRIDLEQLARLEESEQRLRALADSMPALTFTTKPTGEFDYVNRKWLEYVGEKDGFLPSLEAIYLHDDDRADAVRKWLEAVGSGDPFEAEFRLRGVDGEYRWMLARALPFRGPGGAIERWFGTLMDIDDGHRLFEGRALLARELSHRIKNIFAVVSGLVSLRARGREEVTEFAAELSAAIRALGTAHDYVRPDVGHEGASLLAMIRDLLKPYEREAGERVKVTGEDLSLNATAATPLALIIHELATNAAKYGGLSNAEGSVSIDISGSEDGEAIHLNWRETGVPSDRQGENPHEGFGSKLLRMSVEGQLGGTFSREITATGLDVELTIPRERIAA